MDTKPKGKSMQELRRLVAEDESRLNDLLRVWPDLLVEEQVELVLIARSMADGERL